MGSFNQIVLLMGDIEDGRRRAVRDTCHRPFHSRAGSEKTQRLCCFTVLLSYQHLQLYLSWPIHHIIMPFTSLLQMPVTFRLCKKKTSITIFPKTHKMNQRHFIYKVCSRATFWHHLRTLFYALI